MLQELQHTPLTYIFRMKSESFHIKCENLQYNKSIYPSFSFLLLLLYVLLYICYEAPHYYVTILFWEVCCPLRKLKKEKNVDLYIYPYIYHMWYILFLPVDPSFHLLSFPWTWRFIYLCISLFACCLSVSNSAGLLRNNLSAFIWKCL